MDRRHVTTTFELAGYRIVETLGLVRGISVRSRSIIGNIAGGIQSLFGGSISAYLQLCEQARAQAFEIMVAHAERLGAEAVIGIRYDGNEVMAGVTEVLCYSRAVRPEKTAPM